MIGSAQGLHIPLYNYEQFIIPFITKWTVFLVNKDDLRPSTIPPMVKNERQIKKKLTIGQ